jgi:hypothetical protein
MPIVTPAELLGQTAKPSKPTKVIPLTDVQKMVGQEPKSPSLEERWQSAKSDVTNFVTKAAKEYNDAEQAGMQHPVDYSWGMAKGMLGGLIGLGSLAAEGLSGGAKALYGMSEKNAGKNFREGMKAGKKLIDKVAGPVQKHLVVKGKPEEAAAKALGIIPQAITAAGDTSADLTNSPFVGATTQAVGTLVSLLGFKGGVTEISDLARDKFAPKINATLDKSVPVPTQLEVQTGASGDFGTPKTEMINNPAAGPQSSVIKGPPVPPAVNKAGEKSLDDLTADLWHTVKNQREAASTPAGEVQLPGQQPGTIPGPNTVGITHEADETGQHTVRSPNGESLAQESGPYLIEKRTDTAASAQGKGEGVARLERLATEAKKRGLKLASDVSVSPAAEKLWRSLGKKGYQVKMNPAERNPTTGNLVSKDPRVPVFEVTGHPPAKADPVMFQEDGQLVHKSTVKNAFNISDKVKKTPGFSFIHRHLQETVEEIQRNISPESLGPQAKTAAAILAKNMAESQMREANYYTKAKVRRAFWNSRMDNAEEFVRKYEKGEKFDDPILQEVADSYRAWNSKITHQDAIDHIEYEPVDNYLYHVFQDGDKVADFLGARYRGKWGNPGFTKDRVFDLYEQAKKAGYTPKFTNPEDIMLARQHASDIAHMKIQALRDLADAGLAVQIKKGMKAPPDGFANGEFRAPNGERYWVNSKAAQILHNAWNTKSLWQAPGIAGKTFRGAMFLKNTLIPFKLGFSLFHPLHVATIDNATGMVRASKELLAGTKSPTAWFKDMLTSTVYLDSIDQTRSGYRIMKLWRGELPEGELTDADRQSLQWMVEGGFVPEMPIQYRTGALAKFRDAVQRHSATAIWHAPFAVLDAMQKPVFQVWIPSLKAASYLNDARTAIAADPTLLDDPLRRQVAFRKLAKSVDNRYGEMAYSTLFWNRWMKDVAVANTLSLGWQLGFLREYGGAATDLGEALTKGGSLADKARAGLLDRPLFTLFYTTQALAYGGLLTYAMTGKHPQQLLDYVYPRVGTNKDGSAKRVSTMFYPREFWAIADHVKNQGVLSGLGSLVRSKSSGVIGMATEGVTGLNSFGEEIRDPNAPVYKQLEQTLANSLKEFEPISLEAIQRQGQGLVSKPGALSVAGFTPAPRYVTETPAQSFIQRIYAKYYQSKETPYDRVQKSSEVRELRKAYTDADQEKFDSILNKIRAKFKLSPNEENRMIQSLNDPPGSAYIKMFKRLSWQQQKQALDKMSPEERETFLPISNVDHLRYSYIPPEDR